MRAMHRAVAVLQRAAHHALHAEGLDAHAGEDDVGDAVERADFVKMNILRAHAVDLSFRHGDAVENRQRALLHAVAQIARGDQFLDFLMRPTVRVIVVVIMNMRVFVAVSVIVVMVVVTATLLVLMLVGMAVRVPVLMAVIVVMIMVAAPRLVLVLVGMTVRMPVLIGVGVFVLVLVLVTVSAVSRLMHVELHALDILPLRAVEVHVQIAEVQLADFPFQRAGLHAEVDECADHHVAADSGNAVEVNCLHKVE